MKYAALAVPVLFLALFVYALVKKVRLYDTFAEGAKGAIPLVLSLFPYIAVILMLSELFERSGISAALTQFLAPLFRAVGVPPELGKLALMKPFSGSGSTALLSELIQTYGADSHIARCACVMYGSSETVFYISAVYFSASKKKPFAPVVISLVSNFLGMVIGCLLCQIL